MQTMLKLTISGFSCPVTLTLALSLREREFVVRLGINKAKEHLNARSGGWSLLPVGEGKDEGADNASASALTLEIIR